MVSQADSGTISARLTPREYEVLELVASGLTNGEVATRLGVTVHAVKFHLTSIYRKLGVANRTEAAVAFLQGASSWAIDSPPDNVAARQPLPSRPIPPLDLPTDHPRGRDDAAIVDRETTVLSRDLVLRLEETAAAFGGRLVSVLLAGLGALLYRYTRHDEIVIGVRRQGGSTADAIHEWLLLWFEPSSEEAFSAALERVDRRLVEAGTPSDGVLPRMLFSFIEGDSQPNSAPGSTGSGFDLALTVEAGSDQLRITAEFDRELFEPPTVRRLLGHFGRVLEAAAEDPRRSLSSLPMLTNDEQHELLVKWNATGRAYPTRRVDELFSERATATPHKVAVKSGSVCLTYEELDTQANQLAHRLQALGVGPDVLVGICTERSLDMVVGLLGILKAGGAYVPIDPAFPAERQRFMLEDASVRVLLTQEPLIDRLPVHGAEVICLDCDAGSIGSASTETPSCAATPENLAYVIYTSGSTGHPKGVQIPHRALVNFLTTMEDRPGLDADDVLVAVTTLSFDIAGLEIYLPLVSGGQVVVAARETTADPRQLAALIEQSEATVMQATPTTWRMLVDAGWPGRPGLKALCGGEALPMMLAEQLLDRGVELWNMYGPTETTIWSAIQLLTQDEPLTIGRPIANTTVYILDEQLQPVPIGIPGELHIGGEGLARGYLGRPELTAERFIPHPFDSTTGARIYKTGDLARYRSDGTVEFMGRLDHQVKVRGFRIELGEIETVLARHPAVQAAVATAREDIPGDARLVGYVIPTTEPASAAELRRYLGETLPAYMVPSAIVTLDAFPLTPNGKVDRKRLPAPVIERSEDGYVAPRTPLEHRLTAIWEDVLGVRPIGVTDDFFDLGATSIVAAQLFTEIEKKLGATLPIVPIFQAPTIERLARLVEQGVNDRRWLSLVPIQPTGSKPPIFCVHGGAGTVLHLQPLARRLGDDQPFYGLQAPGLYGDVPPLASIEGMSELYLSELREIQPSGPYYLAGYCFGGIVAFDMAHRLLDAGEEVAMLTMFNSPSPAYIRSDWVKELDRRAVQSTGRAEPSSAGTRPATLPRKITRLVREPARARYIARSRWKALKIGLLQKRILAHVRYRRPLPEGLRDRGYLEICALLQWDYTPRPYPGDLLLFNGNGLYDDDPDVGWTGFVRNITSFTVPGDHENNRATMREPHVQFIAEHMHAFLDGSSDERPSAV